MLQLELEGVHADLFGQLIEDAFYGKVAFYIGPTTDRSRLGVVGANAIDLPMDVGALVIEVHHAAAHGSGKVQGFGAAKAGPSSAIIVSSCLNGRKAAVFGGPGFDTVSQTRPVITIQTLILPGIPEFDRFIRLDGE